MNLPTKAEWEAAGFKVPPELCRDENEITPEQWLTKAARGEPLPEDPINEIAQEIVDELQIMITAQDYSWNSCECVRAVEEWLKRFCYHTINNALRKQPPREPARNVNPSGQAGIGWALGGS